MGHVIDSAEGGSGVSVDESYSREVSPGARRAAWLVIVLIGWLLSYAIGWQKGWIVGNSGADERFDRINQTIKDTHLGAVGTAEAHDESAGSA